MIPISKPFLGENETRAVEGVLASGILAQGPRVADLERSFADYIGVKHAIATRNVTTGEGGMLTTNDDNIASRFRLLINHGMRVRYQHEMLGYNFRMTDVAAAIGVEQLKRLDGFNARRAETAAFYDEQLGNI